VEAGSWKFCFGPLLMRIIRMDAMPPNISLNPDAPRRAYGPSFVAPVSFVR
jgi:hypothetical protein